MFWEVCAVRMVTNRDDRRVKFRLGYDERVERRQFRNPVLARDYANSLNSELYRDGYVRVVFEERV